MKLIQHMQSIYRLIGDDRLENLGLFHIESSRLVTPISDDTLSLFTHRSKRANEVISYPVVKELIDAIKASNGYKGINHVGFCYKVASKESAVKLIAEEACKEGYSVYQEPSIDDAAWIFSLVTCPMSQIRS